MTNVTKNFCVFYKLLSIFNSKKCIFLVKLKTKVGNVSFFTEFFVIFFLILLSLNSLNVATKLSVLTKVLFKLLVTDFKYLFYIKSI